MKKKILSRNLWMFSGIVWGISFFRNLYLEGLDLYLIVIGSASILSFISAYIAHKEIHKTNEG